MEIVSATSDLGSTASITRPLGRRTIVCGENRKGKTKFINGIALALTGGLDDFLGRGTAGSSGKPVRTTTEIGRYIGPGRDGLAASVQFDSGETADYALAKSVRTGEMSRTHTIPGVLRDREGSPSWLLMPVREVHAKLAAGPDKARAFFLPYIVPVDVLASSLATALTDEDRRKLRERGLTPPTDFEGVMSLIASCDSNATDCATAADTARRGADQLAATINRPTEAAIAAAEAVAAAARSAYNVKLQSGFRMTASPEALEAEIAGLQHQATALASKWSGYAPGVFPPPLSIPTMEAAIGPVPPNIQAVQSWLADLGEPALALARRGAQAGSGCCATCGTAVNNAALVEYWTAQVTGARAELVRISSEWGARVAWYQNEVVQATNNHEVACAAVRDQDAAYRTDLGAYTVITQQLQAKQAARATLAISAPEDVDPTPLSDYERRTQAADQALAGLREAATTWAGIDQSRERAALLANTEVWWSDLRTRLKAWSEKLIRESLDDFAERVSRYLPKSWGRLMIALENDTGSRTFRIGFDRGGHEVIALCGAEWAAVVLAIAAVILDRDRPPYSVLTLVSDMGWAPDVLGEVMYALRDCPWQIVIASCVMPPAVDGWDILTLDGVTPKYNGGTPVSEGAGAVEPAPRKPRTPRAPRGAKTAVVGAAEGASAQEGDAAPATIGVSGAQAGQTDHQQTTEDLIKTRSQFHALLALGWEQRMITRMSPASLEEASNNGYTPQTHSVLADGSLYAVNPPSLDAFRSPR